MGPVLYQRNYAPQPSALESARLVQAVLHVPGGFGVALQDNDQYAVLQTIPVGLESAIRQVFIPFDCCEGGNSTPVGSISSVVCLHALEKERGVKVTCGEFLKVGGIITLLQTILILIYLFLFAQLDLFPSR